MTAKRYSCTDWSYFSDCELEVSLQHRSAILSLSVLQNQLRYTSFSKLQCSNLGLWPYFLVCWENKHQNFYLLCTHHSSFSSTGTVLRLPRYPSTSQIPLLTRSFPSAAMLYYLPSANDSFMRKIPRKFYYFPFHTPIFLNLFNPLFLTKTVSFKIIVSILPKLVAQPSSC